LKLSAGHKCVQKAFLSGFSTSEISLWEDEAFAEQKAREGEAPAEPKLSAGREMGKSDEFGLTRRFALPLGLPTNELVGYIYKAC